MDWKDHYRDGGDVKRVKYFKKKDEFRENVEAIVGEVDDRTIEKLRAETKQNVEVAINAILDTSNGGDDAVVVVDQAAKNDHGNDINKQTNTAVPAIEEISEEIKDDVDDDDDDDMIVIEQPGSTGLYKQWTRRFIGSFQAQIWATRSNIKLEFNEKLDVKRDKSDPSLRLKTTRQLKVGEETKVRLYKKSGEAIARMSEGDAKFASALLDCGVCQFSATCILEESNIRLGSTISVQLDCYLNKSAFYSDPHTLPPSLGGPKQQKQHQDEETAEDAMLRVKQNALVRLFNKLNVDTGVKEEDVAGASDMISAAEKMGTQMPPEATNTEQKELDQNQLDALYKRSSPPDTNLHEQSPASTFALDLRPYQKKGLSWMIQKETHESEQDEKEDHTQEPMHPLWTEVKWPSQMGHLETEGEKEIDTHQSFYINLYAGELSLNFPRQKKSTLGGVLADEMGLGKTISTLALIHSKYNQNDDPDSQSASRTDFAKHTTLVVAPMSLLSQWESEVNVASKKGTMRALVYYGKVAHGLDLKTFLCNGNESTVPNVVITSYGTLLSEHSNVVEFKKSNPDSWQDRHDLQRFGLFGVKFLRVVLDEGHTIRNRNTRTAKAAFDLRSTRRWVLTGTPIVNRLDDLYSIVKFLGVEPWNNYPFWKAFVSSPFENKGFVQAMHVVQSIMEPLVLRRTKDMKQPDGTPLVQLPPKTVTIQRIKFTTDEQTLYRHIFTRVRDSFKSKLDSGDLMRSYTNLLKQILRLRQVCCHPSLVMGEYTSADNDDLENISTEASESSVLDLADQDLRDIMTKFELQEDHAKDVTMFGSEVVKSIVEGSKENCPLCLEPIDEDQQAITECWHMACLDCLIQQIAYEKNKGRTPRCATCRENISADKLYQVKRRADGRIMLQRYHNRGQSSKVKELINQLHQLYKNPERQTKSPIRTVVFSQFTSYLTLIQRELEREGFNCLRFDGTLTERKRTLVLQEFKNGTKNVVLLISLKAGGVGLNLVEANRAYMMDPWWSYAIEAQAIDRIHRMGQLSEVQIVRFIIEGSVEERILRIQDRKKFLATTLGMSEEEQRAQRLDDIKMLFDD